MRRVFPLLYLLASWAWAQWDLTLTPARVELFLRPGEAFSLSLSLRNGLGKESPISARLAAFGLDEKGGVRETPEPKGQEFCARLRVAPSKAVLPPMGEVEVRVEGVAPQGEGTYACLVAFGGSPDPGAFGRVQVSVRWEVALALYVTLKGTEKPRFRGRVGGEGKELPLLLENPGNVLLRVSGEATVLNPAGQEVARIPLPETPLLPGGTRRLLLAPPVPLPPERYRAVLVVETAYGRYALEGLWVVP